MMQAGKVTLFSLDDGMSQFHQFPLDPNTRDLLSFDGPEGLAVYHVLPMGWTRAPYECTLGLTVIFISFGSDELWKYMDEMLRMTVGFDASLESCKAHLALNLRFWKIAEEANLSLSREKAQHAVKEVKLVNLVFGNGVVRKPESLISGITSLPYPRKMTELRYALNLLEYIVSLMLAHKPVAAIETLTPLLKISHWNSSTWDPKIHGEAWDQVIKATAADVALQMPDLSLPVACTTDWSKEKIAYVATQNFPGVGERIVALVARRTKGGEKNMEAPEGAFYTDAEALVELALEPFSEDRNKLRVRAFLKAMSSLNAVFRPRKGTEIPHVDAITRAVGIAQQRTAAASLGGDSWAEESPAITMPPMVLPAVAGIALSRAVVIDAQNSDFVVPSPDQLRLAGQAFDFSQMLTNCPELQAIRLALAGTAVDDLPGVSGTFKNRMHALKARYGEFSDFLTEGRDGRIYMSKTRPDGRKTSMLIEWSTGHSIAPYLSSSQRRDQRARLSQDNNGAHPRGAFHVVQYQA